MIVVFMIVSVSVEDVSRVKERSCRGRCLHSSILDPIQAGQIWFGEITRQIETGDQRRITARKKSRQKLTSLLRCWLTSFVLDKRDIFGIGKNVVCLLIVQLDRVIQYFSSPTFASLILFSIALLLSPLSLSLYPLVFFSLHWFSSSPVAKHLSSSRVCARVFSFYFA